MEPNTMTIQEKLRNAIANIKYVLQSDRRIFFSVIGISVLVVLFLIMVSLSFLSKKSQPLVTTETPTTVTSPSVGRRTSSRPKIPASITLVRTDPKRIYKVNDLITFTVVAHTSGQQVRGYDAAFKFDTTKVSFVGEKNLFSPMQYMRRVRGNWILLTGTQSMTGTNAIVFSKTKLMDITFKATSAGTASFPLSYIPDSYNDSNLINTDSNDMLTNAGGIVIHIQP